MANYFIAFDDKDKAITILEDYLSSDPKNIKVVDQLANFYLMNGDEDKALEYKFRVLKYYEFNRNKKKLKETKSWILSVDPNYFDKPVKVRNPQATRPWQHVLEPLSGYLNLGKELFNNKKLNGEGFNFGPSSEQNRTVKQLLSDLSRYWDLDIDEKIFIVKDPISFHEATLLKLNCEKSLALLNWRSVLDYKDTIRFTSEWYKNYYTEPDSAQIKTMNQIIEYENFAKNKKLVWTE